MSSEIYDLEQKILECWNITTDLEDLQKADIVDKEEVLDSIVTVYDMKFQVAFNLFEKVCRDYQEKRRICEEFEGKKLCECPTPIDPKQTDPIKIKP